MRNNNQFRLKSNYINIKCLHLLKCILYKAANFVDFASHFLDLSEIKTGELSERLVNLEVS